MPLVTDAPLHIRSVALAVHDPDAVRAWYTDVVGLADLGDADGTVRLGSADTVLLELVHDPDARRRGPREAGLFHTAFLLPERAALANWATHAREDAVRIDGASDHQVSEAFYLTDPEGNGVEIYADRDPALWEWREGEIMTAIERLDVADLMAALREPDWRGLPGGTIVGHVHLQVGEVAASERFVTGTLGVPATTVERDVGFYGSGGYHHHLAGNVWNSRGSAPVEGPVTGLLDVRMSVRDGEAGLDALRERIERTGAASVEEGGAIVLHDPWNTRFSVRAAGRAG